METDQAGSVTSLARGEFERLLRDGVAEKRRQQVDEHSESLLLWLALAPAWPRAYVEAGFPTVDGMVSGRAAVDAVERAVAADLVQSGRNDADPGTPIYWMTQVQADSILSFFVAQPRGPARILSELTAAAQLVRWASTRLPLPDDLARWCRLGEVGPQPHQMAALLDREIDAAVARAESANDTACPDARRWIETAPPIATLFPGPLRVSLLRANRRFELFHRRAADKRHLANFLPRRSQIDDFRSLMKKGDGPWALHYVGSGGAGKTMLIRHITADLAPQLGVAASRIDFDHLNPDYPTREPALLLVALAEELCLYEASGHAGFGAFYSVVNTLQESVDATGGTGSGDAAIQRVRPALTAFIDAIRNLKMQPLFILDTCEELAKLRPDGKIPDNVRVTFDLLELIHGALPELRVVFSGRRPLARKGAGWRSRETLLPERDYLRLHLVNGFTREEALAFLRSFHEGKRALDASTFEQILVRSPAADVTFAQRFEVDDDIGSMGERYNPYDLSMFASLAATGQLTSGVGSHFYVKERIVDRLSPALLMLVPPLVTVGTFDSELIAAVCGRLHLERRDTLAEELAQQHWIGRVTSAAADDPMWTCDAIHRKRLLAYYRDEEAEALFDADRALASILPDLTLERPWRKLSIAYFDAALQLLQHDVACALDWWHRVEEKIAADAEWDWAKRMTAQLLASEDGSWEEAAEKVPDPLLRASILATHAAASARLGLFHDDSLWQAVLTTVAAPSDERMVVPWRRALAGIVNAAQWSTEPPEEVCKSILPFLSSDPFPEPMDGPNLEAEVALLEGAIEVLERVPAEVLDEKRPQLELLMDLLGARHVAVLEWTDLSAFRMSLLGRLEALRGNMDAAERSFRASLSGVGTVVSRREFLYWTPPADLVARLRLEAVRGLALRFSVRKMLVEEDCPPGNSLDSDRLASAALIVRAANNRASSKSLQRPRASGPARCNAHRQIPSFTSTSIELLAAGGEIDDAMKLCRKAMNDAEVNSDVLMQNDLARLEARLICRFRLFERGEVLSRLVTDSTDAADRDLSERYSLLTTTEGAPGYWSRLTNARTPDEILEWISSSQRDPIQALRNVTYAFASGIEEWNSREVLVSVAQRVGKRRAAEIVLEECELLAVVDRLVTAEPLTIAAEWFTAAAEPLGALRANVLSVLCPSSPTTAATIVVSIPSDLPFPRPEDVMSFIRSREPSEGLIPHITGNASGLSPWTRRVLAACLKVTRSPTVARWFGGSYGSLINIRTGPVGKDLEKMTEVRRERVVRQRLANQAPAGGVALIVLGLTSLIWMFAKLFMSSPDGVKGGFAVLLVIAISFLLIWKKETRQGTLGFLLLGGVWLGLYTLAKRTPVTTFFGAPWTFANILAFDLILGTSIYLAFQTPRLKAALQSVRIRLARSIVFSPREERIELKSWWLGSISCALDYRSDQPATANLDYVLLRNELSDETTATLDRWQNESLAQLLPANIRLDEPHAADICWEAMLDPALFDDGELRPRRFATYRTVPAQAMHEAARSTVIQIAASYPLSEEWNEVMAGQERFAHAERGGHAQVNHLVGQPTEVREGIRLELGDGSLGTRSDLLRPDFVRAWPNLVFCVVQGRPNDSTVRTSTDRVIAAQLRRFSAEVFVCGVPFVLVIPPLPTLVAQMLTERIARAVVGEHLTSKESVLWFVDGIRNEILRPPISAGVIDQAYDVCLYLDHVPELRPRRRTRFIRPWSFP